MLWSDLLSDTVKETAASIVRRVHEANLAGAALCPPENQMFRALELVPPEKVKVCIIGQDPYHTPGQANGLAFSVNPGAPLQPSLRNIFKEMVTDLGCEMPANGDLTPWTQQGVLLLNTVLSVYPHKANSCAEWGWQVVTHDVIRATLELPQPIVYLIWGANAKFFVSDLEFNEALGKVAFVSSHPSPFSASRASKGMPAFLGSQPFSRANAALEGFRAAPVKWEMPR